MSANKPSIADRLRDFWQNVKRIVRVARRPSAHEVRLIARVSGIGILIVGVVAYLIQIVGTLVNEFFRPSTSSTSLILQLLIFTINCLPAILSNLAAMPSLLSIPIGLGLIARSFKK